VAQPDPYQNWTGAPKHWVGIPAQRQVPPSEPAPLSPVRVPRAVLVGIAVVAAALLLAAVGPGTSVAGLDGSGPAAVIGAAS
jgi:hypothetical protein